MKWSRVPGPASHCHPEPFDSRFALFQDRLREGSVWVGAAKRQVNCHPERSEGSVWVGGAKREESCHPERSEGSVWVGGAKREENCHPERSEGSVWAGGAKREIPVSRLVLAAFSVAMAFITGCSFFSKTKSTIYTIDRVPGQVTAARGTPIAINSIELPAGFDRKEIVVRKANNELDVRGTEQWPATLSDVVLHTLAYDLADRLPAGMMILPGATKPAAARSIDIVFEDLSAGPDPKVVLDARIATAEQRIEVPVTSLKSADVATGMSQALAQLADRIVSGL